MDYSNRVIKAFLWGRCDLNSFNLSTDFLAILLILLIILSGCFSASETGMMLVNRHRLKHQVAEKDRKALFITRLLQRVDRLLGVILLGNNLVNLLAASIASVIAIRIFGEIGVLISTMVLTVIMLLFAEIGPKTLATLYPGKIARLAVNPLRFLLIFTGPIVSLLNGIVNTTLRFFGISAGKYKTDILSPDEFRAVVHEVGNVISPYHQEMLLSILDLEHVTVRDVMIPRNQIFSIDLDDTEHEIYHLLQESHYARIPVCKQSIDHTIGVIHSRQLHHFLSEGCSVDIQKILSLKEEVQFIPESINLHQQLLNFQREHYCMGLVVDEYGVVLGLITLDDILEEIVGEFSTAVDGKPLQDSSIIKDKDNESFLIVGGSTTLRQINRQLQWNLPTNSAKTLNGLIIEHLEGLPKHATSFRINDYIIEVIDTKNNFVNKVRITPIRNSTNAIDQ